jgi:hypothetical protein
VLKNAMTHKKNFAKFKTIALSSLFKVDKLRSTLPASFHVIFISEKLLFTKVYYAIHMICKHFI